jgi:hypothetical protein
MGRYSQWENAALVRVVIWMGLDEVNRVVLLCGECEAKLLAEGG